MRRRWARWVMVGAVMMGTGVWGEEAGTRPGDEHGRDAHATTLPFTVSKETTGIVSPLREDGTPDYVGALNAKYGKGVKTKDNAFVWFLGVMGTDTLPAERRGEILKLCGAESLGLPEHVDWKPYSVFLSERGESGKTAGESALRDESEAARQLWQTGDFPRLAEYLKTDDAYLDAVKEAFVRGQYWAPFGSSIYGDFYCADMLGRMKNAGLMLADRATMRAKAGDFDGFLSDVAGIKQMAQHVGGSGTLYGRLMGVTLDAFAVEAVGAVAGSGILSDSQCAALWKRLSAFPPLPSLAEVVGTSERWEILDQVITVAMGKGDVLKRWGYGGWRSIDREEVDWDVILRRMNALFDYVEAAIASPDEATQKKGDAAYAELEKYEAGDVSSGDFSKNGNETREAYTQRIGDSILKKLMRDDVMAAWLVRKARFMDEMAKTLVAAAKYRADKEKWPGKLSELASEYVKELPKDFFSEGNKHELTIAVMEKGAAVRTVDERPLGGGRKAFEVGVK